MAFYTIEKRVTTKGEIRYRVTVGVKEGGVYIHRERKTFQRKPLAATWGAQRVAEIESEGFAKKTPGITLRGLILRYMADGTITNGQSKKSSLNTIMHSSLGDLLLSDLTMNRYIEYARLRRQTVKPSTLGTELSYLKTVLDVALPFYDIQTLPTELDAAKIYLTRKNIIAPSDKRTRRPTREEFDLLHQELTRAFNDSRMGIRYHDAFEFAVFSCMRRGEICRITWEDVDFNNRSVIVRDRKDPRKKLGNHMIVPLLGRAWDLLEAQPKISKYIFPYKPGTISEAFRRARDKLKIPDIRLHDMRREAASRLFEYGFSVEEVAQVTGHKNLKTLWTVYREIHPESLHDRFAELQKRNNSDQ
ncbi:tyrosine-type recombinase/integrase [Lelliottia nimipressuralis]|uniref:Site-specific integrase n=1 Tax=Lelliottia nimipressuralis TaxID=69220 RepID=A0ABD4KIE7_9ENTR|nr:site-specific integrase [Lelliottia nimipressuralis]MBF4180582.1 site-specific integrase [Lelliottia nimipressuralis]